MLEKEGFGVAEAENGRVALESLDRMRPSAILLDLMSPRWTGSSSSPTCATARSGATSPSSS
ncbi:MAG: hypothetical protein ACR2HO_12405 [Rubrobacteraceae bacterium]|nr:response regulator [Rubrobacter sp.]